MQNEKLKRFINKIRVITDVLKQELNDIEILAPSEKPLLSAVIDRLDTLHEKMTGGIKL